VQRLSNSGIDPDLLDERVRLMLNLARSDEVVIMLPKADMPALPGAQDVSNSN
jgi:cell division protein FtsB